MAKYFYRASAADFMKIPGAPVAYWAVPEIFSSFVNFQTLGEVASPRKGLATCNDELWLRAWQEVSVKKTSFFEDKRLQTEPTWYPISKGGQWRKWYGNNQLLVNWKDNGRALKQFITDRYSGGSYTKEIRSEKFYFRDCVTWSDISGNSFFGARRAAEKSIISTKGCGIYSDSLDLDYISGFLNSKPAQLFLELTSPTVSTNPGEIASLPIAMSRQHMMAVQAYSKTCREIGRIDWDSFETSWDFTFPPIISLNDSASSLRNAYQIVRGKWPNKVRQMRCCEEENNQIFIEAYSLQDELNPDVPLEEITLTCNPHYRYGGNLREEALESLLQCDTVRELVSYAIGCMMGRYSVDKPGLILASQGETLQDYLRQIPSSSFAPDDDAILPLTDQEWFPDDATNRVREFVRVVWGDGQLQENLDFVAESLCLHAIKPNRGESALDTIRRYLSTQFYKDHLRTYKKRPIYWLFSSGKHKAFECLVYLHRYNEGTLARMRTEYVIPLSAKLNAYGEKLEQDKDASTSAAETKRLEKEITTLYKQQTELAEFDEKLRHYADQRISLDLDDGVKVNYGRFGDLLAEVKAVTGQK